MLGNANPLKDYLQTAPAQYMSGYGVLKEAGEQIASWGSRPFVFAGERAYAAAKGALTKALEGQGLAWGALVRSGECSQRNIEGLVNAARSFGANVMISAGGGKALDTGKAAAFYLGIPVVCIPTTCATCAGASAVSVVYTESGHFEKDIYLPRNPDLVICDAQIIGASPLCYTKAGILDALTKWYEGDAAAKSLPQMDVATKSALALAKMLQANLFQDGLTACRQSESGQIGEAFSRTVDICMYTTALIQGLSQKDIRGAAAHPIQTAMSLIPGSGQLLHGYKVSYGMLVQLMLEEKSAKEIGALTDFCLSLGVTPSLAGLGLCADAPLRKRVAQKARANVLMDNMIGQITQEDILLAMERVEAYVAKRTCAGGEQPPHQTGYKERT